jgi:hypothetical protein
LGRPLLVAPLFTFGAGSIAVFATPNLFFFTIIVLAQVAIFLGIAWMVGLTRTERQSFRNYAHRRLRLPLLRIAHPLFGAAKPVFGENE